MLHGRYKLTGSAAVLPDGRVLVGGGGVGMEVLDVAANISTSANLGSLGRISFSTVNLLGDTILVLGGYDDRIDLTGTFLLASVDTLDRN
jgi:hypothetical protein